MLFKDGDLGRELFQVHAELRKALFELDAWTKNQGFPELTVTHLVRTPEQQESFYWRSYLSREVPEEVAREKARRKFSWHLIACAADLRRYEYSKEQVEQIRAWLAERCPSPMWEFLDETTSGTGPHFHLAVRDYVRRRDFEQATNTSTGAA